MKRENMSGGYTTSGVVSRRKGKRQFPGSPRGGTIYPRAFARERSYPSAPSGRYPIFLAVGEGGAISSRIAPKTGRYRLPPRRFEITVRDLNSSASARVSRNIKSGGNRGRLRATAWFNARTSTR